MRRRAADPGGWWKDRMSNAPRPSKNERRDAAREKAREQRLRQQKREKRNRAVLQLSIGVVIVAIIAVVSVIIVNSVRPAGPGPANMANGGITLQGADLTAVRTAGAAPGATPTPESTPSDGKVLIQVYEDFGCPVCQAFEQANATQIRQLVTSGAAVVQYHPVAILDANFPPSRNYSTRAANAAAAVASYSPSAYSAFHTALYRSGVQPTEGSAGLTDDRLIQLARQADATNMTQIEAAIKAQTYKNWVGDRTDEFVAKTGSLQDVTIPADRRGGTPTVVVNGQWYTGAPNSASEFGSFVTRVGGAVGSATPAPPASASN